MAWHLQAGAYNSSRKSETSWISKSADINFKSTLLDHILESIIPDLVISDMKEKIDPTQYVNQQKTSIYHYLLKMINRIVTSMDKNFKKRKICSACHFLDWKSAYSKQDYTLGKWSFIENGVRPALILLLMNYFQSEA